MLNSNIFPNLTPLRNVNIISLQCLPGLEIPLVMAASRGGHAVVSAKLQLVIIKETRLLPILYSIVTLVLAFVSARGCRCHPRVFDPCDTELCAEVLVSEPGTAASDLFEAVLLEVGVPDRRSTP